MKNKLLGLGVLLVLSLLYLFISSAHESGELCTPLIDITGDYTLDTFDGNLFIPPKELKVSNFNDMITTDNGYIGYYNLFKIPINGEFAEFGVLFLTDTKHLFVGFGCDRDRVGEIEGLYLNFPDDVDKENIMLEMEYNKFTFVKVMFLEMFDNIKNCGKGMNPDEYLIVKYQRPIKLK